MFPRDPEGSGQAPACQETNLAEAPSATVLLPVGGRHMQLGGLCDGRRRRHLRWSQPCRQTQRTQVHLKAAQLARLDAVVLALISALLPLFAPCPLPNIRTRRFLDALWTGFVGPFTYRGRSQMPQPHFKWATSTRGPVLNHLLAFQPLPRSKDLGSVSGCQCCRNTQRLTHVLVYHHLSANSL